VIRSMTGFAAVTREASTEKVHVTVKSVNHRFLDVALKMPQALSVLESRVKAVVGQRLTRGRVEISLSAEVTSPPAREVVIDEKLLEQVDAALAPVRARGLVAGALTPSDLLRIPQVIDIKSSQAEAGSGVADSLAALVEVALSDALDALVTMRETEGRFLATDLDGRVGTIAGFVDALEREAEQGQRRLEEKLRERVASLPADLQGDPAAVAQEVVRYAARSDVDEELVRLRGHMDHWRALADGPEPCGRKLDFLVQEMNREINTIGSKVEGVRGTEVVISAKAELERVKEQVQNVE
jgi:uncharacterized protein (TIGR00255 family)